MRPCEGLSQKLSQVLNEGDVVQFSMWIKIQSDDNNDNLLQFPRPPYSGAIQFELILTERRVDYAFNQFNCLLSWNIGDKKQKVKYQVFTNEYSNDDWYKIVFEPIVVNSNNIEWFFFHIDSKVDNNETEVNFDEYLLIDDASLIKLDCPSEQTCEYATGPMYPTIAPNIIATNGALNFTNLDDVTGFKIELLDALGKVIATKNSIFCPNGFQEDYRLYTAFLHLQSGPYNAKLTYWNSNSYCIENFPVVITADLYELPEAEPYNFCPCRPLNIKRRCCEDELET